MEPQTGRQTDDKNVPFSLDGTELPGEKGRREAAPSGKNLGATPRNLDLILDIPVTLAVELGRTRMVSSSARDRSWSSTSWPGNPWTFWSRAGPSERAKSWW